MDKVVRRLPNGGALHVNNHFDTLFPDAYTSFGFSLFPASNSREYDDSIEITVRVYTAAGSRQFPLILKAS
jgi:hypothetical protein